MKLVRWTRFSWDLAKLPEHAQNIESQYRVRPAERDEEETVRHVVMSAFSLDAAWGDTHKTSQEWLEQQLTEVFSQRSTPCLVITHGSRIIGASALDHEEEAISHLLTGPCVLSEYRNRGLGSALLYHSLRELREAELKIARAVTKDNVPVSKFVYTKFNSQSEPLDFEPAMASS